MAAQRRADITARLRTIHGHLAAVERLLASDRRLEAAVQLRAVRGALGEVAAEVCRDHIHRCLAGRPDPESADEFLLLAHLIGRAIRREYRPRV